MKAWKIVLVGALIITRPLFADGLFTLGGKTLGVQDLTAAQQQQVFEVQSQNYEQTKSLVDNVVFDMYLDEESKKQNKSREDIEKKVLDVKDPSDKTIKKWYDENKGRIPPNFQFEQIKRYAAMARYQSPNSS